MCTNKVWSLSSLDFKTFAFSFLDKWMSYNQPNININLELLFYLLGAEFVVPFSSRSLALKSSLKSHQMTTLTVQNDKVFPQMMMFSLKSFCWAKKVVIWWLLMTTWEREEKRTRNSMPSWCDFLCMNWTQMIFQ